MEFSYWWGGIFILNDSVFYSFKTDRRSYLLVNMLSCLSPYDILWHEDAKETGYIAK